MALALVEVPYQALSFNFKNYARSSRAKSNRNIQGECSAVWMSSEITVEEHRKGPHQIHGSEKTRWQQEKQSSLEQSEPRVTTGMKVREVPSLAIRYVGPLRS